MVYGIGSVLRGLVVNGVLCELTLFCLDKLDKSVERYFCFLNQIDSSFKKRIANVF